MKKRDRQADGIKKIVPLTVDFFTKSRSHKEKNRERESMVLKKKKISSTSSC